MGLIRGGIVLIAGILLFVAFLAMNTTAIMTSSLSYDAVKGEIRDLFEEFANPGSLISNAFGIEEFNLTNAAEDILEEMNQTCQKNETIREYHFVYQGTNITLSCDTLQGGSGAVVNSTVSGFIESFYYQDYACGFFDCFEENKLPVFLISENSHDYWKSKFYLFLLASLILSVLMILFMENRINAPIIIGILLAISALIILKISSFFSFLLGEPISLLVGIFFSRAGFIFWISFILGLALIAGGFGAKLLNLGFMQKLLKSNSSEKVKGNQPKNLQNKTVKPKK